MHLQALAPVVVAEDPRDGAGPGGRFDQIVAIRAEGRRQRVQAVAWVTGGQMRHVMRDDQGRPVMRFPQPAGQPGPRQKMLGKRIRGEKRRRPAVTADQAMIIDFPLGCAIAASRSPMAA